MTFYGEFHGFVAKPYEITAFKFDATQLGFNDMRTFIEKYTGVNRARATYHESFASVYDYGSFIGTIAKGGWLVYDGENLNIYLDKVFHQRFR